MLEINLKIDWGLQSKQSVYLVVVNGKEQNIPGKWSKSIQGRLEDFQAEIFKASCYGCWEGCLSLTLITKYVPQMPFF